MVLYYKSSCSSFVAQHALCSYMVVISPLISSPAGFLHSFICYLTINWNIIDKSTCIIFLSTAWNLSWETGGEKLVVLDRLHVYLIWSFEFFHLDQPMAEGSYCQVTNQIGRIEVFKDPANIMDVLMRKVTTQNYTNRVSIGKWAYNTIIFVSWRGMFFTKILYFGNILRIQEPQSEPLI